MYTTLKTAVYASLDAKMRAEVSDWEINFHINEAQRMLALLLPADLVPEIIKVARTGTNFTGVGNYGFTTHPTAWAYTTAGMQVLSVMVDTVNLGATHTTPNREFAREVSIEEYFKTIADIGNTSVDKIWCVVGSSILTNFKAGVQGGSPDSLLLVKYKDSPAAIPTTGGYVGKVAIVGVSYDVTGGDMSLLKLSTGTWASLVITDGDFAGGTICQSSPAAGSVGTGVPIARIVRLWDDAGVGWLQARGPGAVNTPATGGVFAQWGSTTAVLFSPPSSTYDDAVEDSYLSNKWNLPIIDMALSAIWMKIGDKERSALYAKSGMERLQLMGASVKGAK
jgi:hypothetical protein